MRYKQIDCVQYINRHKWDELTIIIIDQNELRELNKLIEKVAL